MSFYGQTLDNHSYVDLSLVGGDDTSGSDSVQCITDLGPCCSHTQGSHRGDWFFPDGTRLGFSGGGDIFESRGPQRVSLHHRNNADSPSGVYRCSISTNAVRNQIIILHYYCFYRRYHNIWKNDECCRVRPGFPVNPHLYLHWWTCYYCDLDTRLHHCHH